MRLEMPRILVENVQILKVHVNDTWVFIFLLLILT